MLGPSRTVSIHFTNTRSSKKEFADTPDHSASGTGLVDCHFHNKADVHLSKSSNENTVSQRAPTVAINGAPVLSSADSDAPVSTTDNDEMSVFQPESKSAACCIPDDVVSEGGDSGITDMGSSQSISDRLPTGFSVSENEEPRNVTCADDNNSSSGNNKQIIEDESQAQYISPMHDDQNSDRNSTSADDSNSSSGNNIQIPEDESQARCISPMHADQNADCLSDSNSKSDMTFEVAINYSSDGEMESTTTKATLPENSDTDDADEAELHMECENVPDTICLSDLCQDEEEAEITSPGPASETQHTSKNSVTTSTPNNQQKDGDDTLSLLNTFQINDATEVQSSVEEQRKETNENDRPQKVDESPYQILRSLITQSAKCKGEEIDKKVKSSQKQIRFSADLVMGTDGLLKLHTGSAPTDSVASKISSHRLMVAPDQSSKLQLYMVPNDVRIGRDKRAFLVLPPNGTGWEIKPNQAGANTITPVYTQQSTRTQKGGIRQPKKVRFPRSTVGQKTVVKKATCVVDMGPENIGNLKTVVTNIADSFNSKPMNQFRVQPVVGTPESCNLKSTSSRVPLFNSNFVKIATQDGVTMSSKSELSAVQNKMPIDMKIQNSRPDKVLVKFAKVVDYSKMSPLKSVLKPKLAPAVKPYNVRLPLPPLPSCATKAMTVNSAPSVPYSKGDIIHVNKVKTLKSFLDNTIDAMNEPDMDIKIDSVFSLAPDNIESSSTDNSVAKKDATIDKIRKSCSSQFEHSTNKCRVVLLRLELDETKNVFNVKKLSQFQKDTCTKWCREGSLQKSSDFVQRSKDDCDQSNRGKNLRRRVSKRTRELPQRSCVTTKRVRSDSTLSDGLSARSDDVASASSPVSTPCQATESSHDVTKPVTHSGDTACEITCEPTKAIDVQTAYMDATESLIGYPRVKMPISMLQSPPQIAKALNTEAGKVASNSQSKAQICTNPRTGWDSELLQTLLHQQPKISSKNSFSNVSSPTPLQLQQVPCHNPMGIRINNIAIGATQGTPTQKLNQISSIVIGATQGIPTQKLNQINSTAIGATQRIPTQRLNQINSTAIGATQGIPTQTLNKINSTAIGVTQGIPRPTLNQINSTAIGATQGIPTQTLNQINSTTIGATQGTPAQKFYLVKVQDKNILIPINDDNVQPRAYLLDSKTTEGKKASTLASPSIPAMQNKIAEPRLLPRPQIVDASRPMLPRPTQVTQSNFNASPANPSFNQNYKVEKKKTDVVIKPEAVNRGYSDETTSGKSNVPSKGVGSAMPVIKPEPLDRGYSDEPPVCTAPIPTSKSNCDVPIPSESPQTSGVKNEISQAERIRQLKERLKEQKKALEDLKQHRPENKMPLEI